MVPRQVQPALRSASMFPQNSTRKSRKSHRKILMRGRMMSNPPDHLVRQYDDLPDWPKTIAYRRIGADSVSGDRATRVGSQTPPTGAYRGTEQLVSAYRGTAQLVSAYRGTEQLVLGVKRHPQINSVPDCLPDCPRLPRLPLAVPECLSSALGGSIFRKRSSS